MSTTKSGCSLRRRICGGKADKVEKLWATAVPGQTLKADLWIVDEQTTVWFVCDQGRMDPKEQGRARDAA